MSCAVHWTAYVSAISLPIIGSVAALIAYRQSQIAGNKLKFELFERRNAVYEVMREAIRKSANGKLSSEDEFNFLSGISPAKWLFEAEVYEYVDKTLWPKLVDAGLQHTMIADDVAEGRIKAIKAHAETVKWLIRQLDEVDRLFKPYLQLKH